jgi:F0F1-type ATP synthase epsilon subunit
MVNSVGFQLMIRTPHEVALESAVRSVRVPTETGHVGLRPRTEPCVIAVEPGILNARLVGDDATSEVFVGTAGGLLMCDRNTVTLFTPLAVVGDNETALVQQLDDLMRRPNSEMETRSAFSKLEGHILTEIRREQTNGVTPRLD